ncbi:oligosaccharide flippase family protein [Phenylobacterium sp. J426]|uniref:oligosaccharide flippase family protein n=1 Tax=Phenylobacterium sp. J426 TaxID=2898439 RepID=UPI0021512D32|nr:oligosaccharide flippase family protein [Phenylobacterium sp. J426]MCR5876728.1 oligosaccharide flippase family protein [Phenylobacterium sp. J426]
MPTFVAPPIGIALLGEAGFGTVLALLALVSWMNLGTFGLHSALGQVIAYERSNPTKLRQLLSSALICSAAFTSVATLLLAWAIQVWANSVPLPPEISRTQLHLAALAMIILGAANVFLQVFEGVNIGTLKQFVTNYCRAAGSALSLVALMTLPWLMPQPVTFIAAIAGGQLIGSLLLAGIVAKTYQPYFRVSKGDLADLVRLARGGASFFVIQIASLVQSQLPVVLLSASLGPARALDLGLVLRLLVAFVTVISMVSSTTWPAIARAIGEGDRSAHVMARWLGAFILAAAAAAFSGLTFFGDELLRLWTGHGATSSPLFYGLCGFFFAQVAWGHLWAVLLIASGRTKTVAILYSVEAAIMAGLTLMASKHGSESILLGLVSAAALTSTWLLPIFATRAIRDWSKTRGEATA